MVMGQIMALTQDAVQRCGRPLPQTCTYSEEKNESDVFPSGKEDFSDNSLTPDSLCRFCRFVIAVLDVEGAGWP